MSSRGHHGDLGGQIDYHYWATGQKQQLPPANRPANPVQTWEVMPEAWFNNYELAGSNIEGSHRSQDNWRLADMGQGAIRFQAANAGGGLVVTFSAWNQNDLQGYFVVLDDDKNESYVLKLASLGSDRLLGGNGFTGARSYARVPGVSADATFRLSPTKIHDLWVMYKQGSIVVGEGKVPGQGRQILYMPAEPGRRRDKGQDMYHFGFSRLGSRWSHPIRVKGVQSLKYKLAAEMPLPPNQLLAGAASGPMFDSSKALYQGGTNQLEVAIGGRQDKGYWASRDEPPPPMYARRSGGM
jgi:hypothetical protein